MSSLVKSTPPPKVVRRESNSNSLFLLSTIGSKIAPLPLPPVNVTDITLLISNDCGSTIISFNSPFTTG